MNDRRVVVLIDMDCFYVQVEQRGFDHLSEAPCAVAQYQNWRGGGLIAVNYEARRFGVKRGMRGEDAKLVCPQLHLFSVPEVKGKADLTKYRSASAEVFTAITEFGKELALKLEKASIDEAFLDITEEVDKRELIVPKLEQLESTHLQADGISLSQWLEQIQENSNYKDIRLAIGAVIVKEIRDRIFEKTQFRCSAGISYNKMLAKLSCGINKPNAQTILPSCGINSLFDKIDISKVRNLGGKLGEELTNKLEIKTMGQLRDVDVEELKKAVGVRTAYWLLELANGVDDEKVSDRILAKTIGCGKNFSGKDVLTTQKEVHHWIKTLSEELMERLKRDCDINKRMAKIVIIGFRFADRDSISRSVPLDSYCDGSKLADVLMKQIFSKIKLEPVVSLMMSASKFVENSTNVDVHNCKLETFFGTAQKKDDTINSKTIENGVNNFIEVSDDNSNESLNQFDQKSDADISEIASTSKEAINLNGKRQPEIYNENSLESLNIKRGFFYRKMKQLNLVLETDEF